MRVAELQQRLLRHCYSRYTALAHLTLAARPTTAVCTLADCRHGVDVPSTPYAICCKGKTRGRAKARRKGKGKLDMMKKPAAASASCAAASASCNGAGLPEKLLTSAQAQGPALDAEAAEKIHTRTFTEVGVERMQLKDGKACILTLICHRVGGADAALKLMNIWEEFFIGGFTKPQLVCWKHDCERLYRDALA